MREKIQRFMIGRYGADEFGKALNIVALILIVVSSFFAKVPAVYIVLYWGGFGLLVYETFRIFSKNVAKRYAENQKYRTFRYRVVTKFDAKKKQFEQRNIYRFYRCPSCKQQVRVPKGRGKICITCPRCKSEFIKRS